ncbi:MAG: OB-fold nucleic acid binding domain-containing protein [Actinomycetota bacterium]|nr:OB-fold nucleic acid binding domain-containing protein [Actinomycetota bacterium]
MGPDKQTPAQQSPVPPGGATSPSRVEPRGGLFGRMAQRLTRTEHEDEDDELRDETHRVGATPICNLPNRERADVCGTVRSVTLRPRADVPALVVEIYDGSRPLHLVWLGRREIAGIHAGVQLRATGRVSYYRGIPTIFNPFYEIVPKSA